MHQPTLHTVRTLVIAIGVKYGANDDITMGPIHISGLALAAVIGIVLNALLPHEPDMKVKKNN